MPRKFSPGARKGLGEREKVEKNFKVFNKWFDKHIKSKHIDSGADKASQQVIKKLSAISKTTSMRGGKRTAQRFFFIKVGQVN